MNSSQGIIAEHRDQVATITIDSPGHLNAVNGAMMVQLAEAITRAEEQECVLLRLRANGQDFSIGREHFESPRAETGTISPADWTQLAVDVFGAVANFSGISIAEVRGSAFGFSAALALRLDLCVASQDVRFAFDEISKGFAPRLVIGQMLGLLDERTVMKLVVTGRAIDADEAFARGLISYLVPDDLLTTRTDALIEELLQLDADGLRNGKRYIHELRTVPVSDRGEFTTDRVHSDYDRGAPRL